MSLSTLFSDLSLAGLATLLVLLVCSLYGAALGWELRKRWLDQHLDGDWLLAQLRYLLYSHRQSPEQLGLYLAQLDRPVARILRELVRKPETGLESGDYLLSTVLEREKRKLETGLSGLGTVAVIAPFVGLFGTVVGITNTFAEVADQGQAGIEVVSAGVSEALVATAIGLLVAIVSVVLFNTFRSRFDREVSDWDATARTLLVMFNSKEAGESVLRERFESIETESAHKFLESLNQNATSPE